MVCLEKSGRLRRHYRLQDRALMREARRPLKEPRTRLEKQPLDFGLFELHRRRMLQSDNLSAILYCLADLLRRGEQCAKAAWRQGLEHFSPLGCIKRMQGRLYAHFNVHLVSVTLQATHLFG